MIKLADWCEKNGVKYLTGWRWFRDGKMPVNAIQTETGTILVDDVILNVKSEPISEEQDSSVIAQIIKKSIEISKSGAPVEDLASFIISNFKLEKNSSFKNKEVFKIKPTKEMAQNHFKQFMVEKEKPVIKDGCVFHKEEHFNNIEYTNSILDTTIISKPSKLDDSSIEDLISQFKTQMSFAAVQAGTPEAIKDIGYIYRPVSYDEAKNLLSLTTDISDPLILDRKAKKLCLLDREVFDDLLKSVSNKS